FRVTKRSRLPSLLTSANAPPSHVWPVPVPDGPVISLNGGLAAPVPLNMRLLVQYQPTQTSGRPSLSTSPTVTVWDSPPMPYLAMSEKVPFPLLWYTRVLPPLTALVQRSRKPSLSMSAAPTPQTSQNPPAPEAAL